MSYNRYQIPPNFDICRLHIKAALPFHEPSDKVDLCPCCERWVGDGRIPICTPTSKLIKIGEQIPLYFMYIRLIVLLCLVFAVLLVIQYFASGSVQKLEFQLELPSYDVQTITIGYIEKSRWVRFIYFIIWILLVLAVRAYLKKIKYEAQNMTNTLSDKSVMLTNVSRKATLAEIKEKFGQWDIDKVVFTYKVSQYHKCLMNIYKIQKEKLIARKKGESRLKLDLITDKVEAMMVDAEKIFQTFKKPQNQLDIVFITFYSDTQRDVFIAKHKKNLFMRLFYKFCTCCSGTAIQGQHITVQKAPQPQDIDWLNLEFDYWTKKIHRASCYYMCLAILIYGVLFQYQISIFQSSDFVISIVRTIVVFIVNFLIITLLQYTTYEVEKHELNTNKVLSLVKKLTFFIFLNLSMSPLTIFIYYQFIKQKTKEEDTAFDQLCFSVLTICIGNIFKPLAEYFNVVRFTKFIGFYFQKRKGKDSQLTQEEAHTAYEPIPFPLGPFYSLLISSIFFTAFFLSCFQIFIVIQILACGVLFITSKYMLLKVCKEPVGFKNHIARLSQRLLVVSIYIYWIGDKIMYFCLVDKDNQSFSDYIFDFGAFGIIQIIFMVLIFIFSSTLISRLMKRFAEDEDIRASLIQQANRNTNKIQSYEQVNSIKLIEEEYKKIFRAM